MTRAEIIQWLRNHYIYSHYTINEIPFNDNRKGCGFSVDVHISIELSYEDVQELPFKFGKIDGNFYVNGNNLTSIENGPDYVSGDYRCDSNIITSLKGAPRYVGGTFCCGANLLTSLEYFPEKVGSGVYIETNPFIENDHYFQTLYNIVKSDNYADDLDSLLIDIMNPAPFENWIMKKERIETINNIIA